MPDLVNISQTIPLPVLGSLTETCAISKKDVFWDIFREPGFSQEEGNDLEVVSYNVFLSGMLLTAWFVEMFNTNISSYSKVHFCSFVYLLDYY